MGNASNSSSNSREQNDSTDSNHSGGFSTTYHSYAQNGEHGKNTQINCLSEHRNSNDSLVNNYYSNNIQTHHIINSYYTNNIQSHHNFLINCTETNKMPRYLDDSYNNPTNNHGINHSDFFNENSNFKEINSISKDCLEFLNQTSEDYFININMDMDKTESNKYFQKIYDKSVELINNINETRFVRAWMYISALHDLPPTYSIGENFQFNQIFPDPISNNTYGLRLKDVNNAEIALFND